MYTQVLSQYFASQLIQLCPLTQQFSNGSVMGRSIEPDSRRSRYLFPAMKSMQCLGITKWNRSNGLQPNLSQAEVRDQHICSVKHGPFCSKHFFMVDFLNSSQAKSLIEAQFDPVLVADLSDSMRHSIFEHLCEVGDKRAREQYRDDFLEDNKEVNENCLAWTPNTRQRFDRLTCHGPVEHRRA